MTLKEPDVADTSAIAEFIRECGDTAARAAPTKRYPKKAKAPEEPQFNLFPSPHESAAAQRFLERRADPDAKSQLTFKGDEDSKTIAIISGNHDKDYVAGHVVAMDTFATGYFQFSQAMIAHLQTIARDRWGRFDAEKLGQVTAIIQGINPQNELETMLAVQMAAVHLGTMKTAESAMTANMREHQQWAGSCLAKLSRTFAMQVDTLKNLRLNGTQHIHIHHHRDEDGPRGSLKNKRQPHAPRLKNQRNQTGQSAASHSLLREIKKIGKGLPRPRDARS